MKRPFQLHRAVSLGALALAMILALGLVSACGDGKDIEASYREYDDGPLEITGNYVDEYGDSHQVTGQSWTILSIFGDSIVHILDHSNASNFLVGQNDATVSWNPGKYSRHDWTFFGGKLYYCTSAFDKNTLAEAYAAGANPANPPVDGCGGFSWTNLTP